MSEWKEHRLSELTDIRISNVDKKSLRSEQPVHLCNYMDVYSNEYVRSDIEFMEATANLGEIERFSLKKGDVLITKDSETPFDIGIPSVLVDDVENLVCGYHLALLRPRASSIDSVFLSKALARTETKKYFAQVAAGSTRYGLSNGAIAKTVVRAPSLPEQKKIATIQQTVDEAIEKTEALIEKYSQIKTGMMQDLFTRGLTADGKLRPARSEAPELYQETPIGWLPNDWTVGGLLSVTDDYRQPILTGPFGADLGNADFVDEGVPLLRIGNVQNGYLALDDLLFVTEGKAAQLSRYRVKSGDLLFARQGATTGRNCLANASVEGYLINYHIIRVALDHEKCAPVFIEAAFNERAVKNQIERDKGRGTREGINTQQLIKLCVPFPPLPEQRAIAALLENTNSVVQQERRSLEKLHHQKSGLMHDLLTGERPVKLDDPEPADV